MFESLFNRLAIERNNGLFITTEGEWRGKFSSKIEQTIDLINPYALFLFNGEPFILFFSEDRNTVEVHRDCWNFNQIPVVIFVSDIDIKIYNGFELENRSFLKILDQSNRLENFSYWNIVSGKTWEEYGKFYHNSSRVDQKLLNNINDARKLLLNKELAPTIANNLIGRLIFLRYLIDRNVRIYFNIHDRGNTEEGPYLSKDKFLLIILNKQILYNLFEYINAKFKGDLFPIVNHEKEAVTNDHLFILYRLFNGDELDTNQASLFDVYNFNIIPIEFISNVYEYFMGEERQGTQKTYYTPPFLVNYILNNTISRYFEENKGTYTCKVLDPTCGSGIFLVESFRRIVSQFEKVEDRKITNNEQELLKKLAIDNIYGIDKDADAVNVAIFSLYITLLDFQDPKDIEVFQFPSLLNQNFFVEDFFDFFNNQIWDLNKENNYSVKLYDINFNFILGNPPWGTVENSPYMEYIKRRQRIEKEKIGISDKQFAQAFLVRTGDFCKEYTKCAFVITSKILYNNNADVFRRYFLNKNLIEKVVELSPVRQDVFLRNESSKRAIGPAAIIFYKFANGADTSVNIVTHISIKHNIFYNLFKILVIEKNDVKSLKQELFKRYDWLWKVLLYGNAFDFRFIQRLKEYEETIHTLISDQSRFIYGTGIILNGGDINDSSMYVGRRYLDTRKRHLTQFYINYENCTIWEHAIVHRKRREVIFLPPMLLIKKGLSREFKATAATSNLPLVFTDSITSIKALNDSDVDTLLVLEGIINSKLFTYYLLCSASSVGVEREQAFGEDEFFSFPYLYNEKVRDLVREIKERLASYNSIFNLKPFFINTKALPEDIYTLVKDLDESIYELYEVDKVEKSLINYSHEVSISLFHNENKAYREVREAELKAYTNVFYNHFSKIYNGRNGNYFQIVATITPYFIKVSANVVTDKPQEHIKYIQNDSIDMKALGMLSFHEEIPYQLYIQKDLKGFDNYSFFILKPNEYKCWHESIAFADLAEVRDKIIKSAQKQKLAIK